MKTRGLAVLLLGAALLVAAPAAADVNQAVRVDAHVQQSNPSTNYETATTMPVTNASSKRYAYVKFDVPAVPAGDTLDAVLLRVHVSTSVSGATLTADRVANTPWTEINLTWNAQPSITTSNVGSVSLGGAGWYTFPVSGVTPSSIASFRLRVSTTSTVSLSSQENANGNDAELILDTTTPPPPPVQNPTASRGSSACGVVDTDYATGASDNQPSTFVTTVDGVTVDNEVVSAPSGSGGYGPATLAEDSSGGSADVVVTGNGATLLSFAVNTNCIVQNPSAVQASTDCGVVGVGYLTGSGDTVASDFVTQVDGATVDTETVAAPSGSGGHNETLPEDSSDGSATVTVTGNGALLLTFEVDTDCIAPPPVMPDPIMGVSSSPNDHGGTENWDSWRTYTESSLYSLANKAEPNRPVAILYTKQGSPFSGSYQSIYDTVTADLNAFYYTSGMPSTRWGIRLYWSNGNEMSNKGMLASTPHSQANINLFVTSQRALYDAVHQTAGGVRRFPDAYAGSDPTTEQERDGIVADWLHPSIQYHDFVAWSMYPAGRKDTPGDPTYNWPSTNPADSDVAPHGYVVRCFERVRQALDAAGLPRDAVSIHVGEVGIGDDPDDSTTRPYWAVHGFMHAVVTISEAMGIPVGTVNWWDAQVDASAPQNILSDEPATTNPSTRVAWQNWESYDHLRGGTHPGSWVGNPKPGWKTTGTVY